MAEAGEIDLVAFLPLGQLERLPEPVVIKGCGDITM